VQANGNVLLNAPVLVQANGVGGAGVGKLDVVASFEAEAHNRISFTGNGGLTVNAHGVSSGTEGLLAFAHAELEANTIQQAVANGQGNISVNASALGAGNVKNATAIANFSANADVGGLVLQGDFGVHATAVDPGTGAMLALGAAHLQANSG